MPPSMSTKTSIASSLCSCTLFSLKTNWSRAVSINLTAIYACWAPWNCIRNSTLSLFKKWGSLWVKKLLKADADFTVFRHFYVVNIQTTTTKIKFFFFKIKNLSRTNIFFGGSADFVGFWNFYVFQITHICPLNRVSSFLNFFKNMFYFLLLRIKQRIDTKKFSIYTFLWHFHLV